jgi:hypothetical protein
MILEKFNKALIELKKQIAEKSNKQIFNFGAFLDKLPPVYIEGKRLKKQTGQQFVLDYYRTKGLDPLTELVDISFTDSDRKVTDREWLFFNEKNSVGYWKKDTGEIQIVFPRYGVVQTVRADEAQVKSILKEASKEEIEESLIRALDMLIESLDKQDIIESIKELYPDLKVHLDIGLLLALDKNKFKDFYSRKHELTTINGVTKLNGQKLTQEERTVIEKIRASLTNTERDNLFSKAEYKTEHPCLKLFQPKDKDKVSKLLGRLGIAPKDLLLSSGEYESLLNDTIKAMPKNRKKVFSSFLVAKIKKRMIVIDKRYNIYLFIDDSKTIEENASFLENIGEEALTHRLDYKMEQFVENVLQTS